MNRPRESLLTLFDPLHTSVLPATPGKRTPSPDSDKENNEPTCPDGTNLTLTTFFNRTYKPRYPSPVVLKRRLVDVGDATIMETPNEEEEEEANARDEGDSGSEKSLFEEEMEDTCSDDDVTIHAPAGLFNLVAAKSEPPAHVSETFLPPIRTPSSPRTPLCDLAIEIAPLARKKLYKRECISGPKAVVSAQTTARLPRGSPLTFTAKSVDALKRESCSPPSERSTAGTVRVSYEGNGLLTATQGASKEDHDNSATGMPDVPAITVSSSASSSVMPSVTLAESELPSFLSQSHLRPRTQKSSGTSNHRNSVDLQASFNLHLQSSDASFDLLNDKISFFGQDLMGEDPDFDLQKEEEIMDMLVQSMSGKEGDNCQPCKRRKDFNSNATEPQRSEGVGILIDIGDVPVIQPSSQIISSTMSIPIMFEPRIEVACRSETSRNVCDEGPALTSVSSSVDIVQAPLEAMERLSTRDIPAPRQLYSLDNRSVEVPKALSSRQLGQMLPIRDAEEAKPPCPQLVPSPQNSEVNELLKDPPVPTVPIAGLKIIKRTTKVQGHERVASSSSNSTANASSEDEKNTAPRVIARRRSSIAIAPAVPAAPPAPRIRAEFAGVRRPPPGMLPPPIPARSMTVTSLRQQKVTSAVSSNVSTENTSKLSDAIKQPSASRFGSSRLQKPATSTNGSIPVKADAQSRNRPEANTAGSVSGLKQPLRYGSTTNGVGGKYGSLSKASKLPAPVSTSRIPGGVSSGGGSIKGFPARKV